MIGWVGSIAWVASVAPAWAGRIVEPLLPSAACATFDDASRQVARRRAEDEWRAIGFPEGTVGLSVTPSGWCCVAMFAVPVDAESRPLGSMSFNSDCTVLGWGTRTGPQRVDARTIQPVDPTRGPPTASSALVTAWNAVHDRPDVTGDTWYAVPTRGGWDVWITRWWGFDALTTAVVRVEDDRVVQVRPVIRGWVLPPEVEAARAADTFRSHDGW